MFYIDNDGSRKSPKATQKETMMIKPHGADELKPLYIEDDAQRDQLSAAAQRLPALLVASGTAASAVMLGAGYFTPLEGFMNLDETRSVAAHMRLPNGLVWPVPVVNIVPQSQ